MGVIAGFLPGWLAVEEFDFDFYSTAAQVIPLIFVALAFEFRGEGGQFVPRDLVPSHEGGSGAAEAAARKPGLMRWTAIYTLVLTVILIIGEIVALHVVATDSPSRGAELIVSASLAYGGFGIVFPIGLQQFNMLLDAQGGDAARALRLLGPTENIPERAFKCVIFSTAVVLTVVVIQMVG